MECGDVRDTPRKSSWPSTSEEIRRDVSLSGRVFDFLMGLPHR